MIYDIRVLPRQELSNIIDTGATFNFSLPWVLISIYSGTTGPLITSKLDFEILASKGCVDYTTFEFHDITLQEYNDFKNRYSRAERRFRLFSKSQAKDMLNFVGKFREGLDPYLLVIHCHQGVSRSGAAGIFFCRYLGLDEKRFRVIHPAIKPNSYVYDMLCAASKFSKEYEKFWEKEVPEHQKYIPTDAGALQQV